MVGEVSAPSWRENPTEPFNLRFISTKFWFTSVDPKPFNGPHSQDHPVHTERMGVRLYGLVCARRDRPTRRPTPPFAVPGTPGPTRVLGGPPSPHPGVLTKTPMVPGGFKAASCPPRLCQWGSGGRRSWASRVGPSSGRGRRRSGAARSERSPFPGPCLPPYSRGPSRSSGPPGPPGLPLPVLHWAPRNTGPPPTSHWRCPPAPRRRALGPDVSPGGGRLWYRAWQGAAAGASARTRLSSGPGPGVGPGSGSRLLTTGSPGRGGRAASRGAGARGAAGASGCGAPAAATCRAPVPGSSAAWPPRVTRTGGVVQQGPLGSFGPPRRAR